MFFVSLYYCKGSEIMALPIKDGKITFGYGVRYTGANAKKGRHKGVDFATKVGTPVYATVSGVVNHAGTNGVGPTRGWGSAYGTQIIINNDKFADGSAGYWSGYMHLSKVKVKRGQRVKKGQLIGYTGNTGSSTGPHLHLEVQRTRFWGGWLGSVNPDKWLKA
jgi:murein DD-endopeptidase MepM/ murein hydrolase activator NlpD